MDKIINKNKVPKLRFLGLENLTMNGIDIK